jgi:hypothetical protein
MSRAYRISVEESLDRTVEVEDGICTSLPVLPVLPKERMGEILGKELEKDGFENDGKNAVRKDPDGVEISIELETGNVSIKKKAEKDIHVEDSKEIVGDWDFDNKEKQDAAKREMKRKLEEEVKGKEEELRKETTKQLEGRLRDLKKELDGAATRATKEALKERAGQLGEIENISEGVDGSMTIKVKV